MNDYEKIITCNTIEAMGIYGSFKVCGKANEIEQRLIDNGFLLVTSRNDEETCFSLTAKGKTLVAGVEDVDVFADIAMLFLYDNVKKESDGELHLEEILSSVGRNHEALEQVYTMLEVGILEQTPDITGSTYIYFPTEFGNTVFSIFDEIDYNKESNNDN